MERFICKEQLPKNEFLVLNIQFVLGQLLHYIENVNLFFELA